MLFLMYIQKYIRPPYTGHKRLLRYQRGILALTLAMMVFLGTALYQSPQVHAIANPISPMIHWDQSMIFSGQNHNNPWGPVGEAAVVHGSGFTSGQQLKLIVVPGDSNTTPSACQPATYTSPNSAVVGQATVSASGSFDANFTWPGGIGNTTSSPVLNSICALNASDNTVVSSKDDGPFTVLTQSLPTVSLSTETVSAGESITVSGQNWVPPQQLTINIAGCEECDPGNTTLANVPVNSTGQNTGSFSASVMIPVTANPANYLVNVLNQSGTLDAYHIGTGVQHLAVTASLITPTPTAAASPTAAATQTVVATATPAPASNSASSNSSSGGGGNGATLIVLVAIIVVVLAIVGLVIFMLMQRKKQALDTPLPPSIPVSPLPGQLPLPGQIPMGQFHQQAPPGNPLTPFPTNQPVSTPGQFGNPSGSNLGNYNQPWQGQGNNSFNNFSQNQPWPSNPQSGGGFTNFPFPPQAGNFPNGMNQRNCVRCGNPLEPDSVICGNCGMRHTPAGNPGGPTSAY
jgi:hypothetical protein